jgi:NTE family protein
MKGGRLLVAAFLAVALGAAAAERPHVCVVLSGGGARGAAHIGVLKALEEYRVPIDCIAGTSMGALVGAAYATGMSTAEMEKLVGELSTQRLFNEKPPRAELSVRRKQEDQFNFVGPEVGLRDGEFFLQKGVVSGIQLETVLRQLARARGYRRFDELPIPFRAVATDLVTGRAVVFGDGELASVMRASMSVPGLVAPTEIGDMLLVDGGLINNLPIDIAREMRADVVIAVNLGTPLLPRKALGSVLGVTEQMLFILTEQNVRASIATLTPRDVLIEPELGDYSFGNFDNMSKTIPIGAAAAHKVQGFLSRLSLPPAEYAALRERQLARIPTDARPVDVVRFEPMKHVNPDVAATHLDTKAGMPIDQNVLDRDIRRLYGTADFEHIGYRIVDEDGKRVLVIDAAEKSWGPNYLRLGLGFSTDFQSEAYFNVHGSYRRTWVNSLGAEWLTHLQIGRVNAFMTEFYQPLTLGGMFFVAPRIEATLTPTDVFDGNRRLARINVTQARAAFDLGAQVTNYGEARIGIARGQARGRLQTGTVDFTGGIDRVREGAYTGRLFFDRLDSVSFPHAGWDLEAQLYGSRPSLGARDTYTKWFTGGDAAHSFGDHTFLVGGIVGGHAGGDKLPIYDLFAWGGFLRGSGYRSGALIGDRIQFGRLLYYQKLVRQTLLQGVYAGLSVEALKIGGSPAPGTPTGWIKSGSLYLGVDTLLGPLYLGYGQASGGLRSFYFYLGRPF